MAKAEGRRPKAEKAEGAEVTGFEEQNMLDLKLEETGERERLKQCPCPLPSYLPTLPSICNCRYIISHLNESGWREALRRGSHRSTSVPCRCLQDLKKQCVEFIQNKGVEKVTLEVRGFKRQFRNLLAFSSRGLEGHDLGHCPQGEGGHPREAEG